MSKHLVPAPSASHSGPLRPSPDLGIEMVGVLEWGGIPVCRHKQGNHGCALEDTQSVLQTECEHLTQTLSVVVGT